MSKFAWFALGLLVGVILVFAFHSAPGLTDQAAGEAAAFVVCPVSTNVGLMPDASRPPEGLWGAPVRVSACPGEWESLSFAVWADKTVKGLTITARGLPVQPDIKVVKVWWQHIGSPSVYDPTKRQLEAELLMHDDSLITRDDSRKENVLHFENLPHDSASLQPVDIPEGTMKQFWLTLRVPKKAKPGTYEGELEIAKGAEKHMIPLVLTVRDMELLPCPKYQGIYLVPPGGSFDEDSQDLFLTLLRDCAEHGIVQPEIRSPGSRDLLARVVGAGQGMGLWPYGVMQLTGALGLWYPLPSEEARKLVKEGLEWQRWCKENGLPKPLFYGPDELAEYPLRQVAPLHRDFWIAGLDVLCACSVGYFDEDGPSYTYPVIEYNMADWAPPLLADVHRAHRSGATVLNYGYFLTCSNPLVNRYRAGYYLWTSPFDGFNPWVYCHEYSRSVYEADFASPGFSWKFMGVVYPGDNGVISTLQGEGYREGIDDLRYVGTLAAQVMTAKKIDLAGRLSERVATLSGEEAAQLNTWLTQLGEAESLLGSPAAPVEKRLAGRNIEERWSELLDGNMFDAQREKVARMIQALAAITLADGTTLTRPLDTRELTKRGMDLAKEVNSRQVNRLFPNPYSRDYPYGWTEFPAGLEYLAACVREGRYREGVWAGYRLSAAIEKRATEKLISEPEAWALRGKVSLDWRECLRQFFGPSQKREPTAAELFEASISGDQEKVARLTLTEGERWQKDFEVLQELPEKVPFRVDDDVVGVEEGWFALDYDDSAWKQISTANWIELQGYDLVDGYMWYRFSFSMPQWKPDKKVYALFRGVDESGDVYLNGKFIGKTFPDWRTPSVVELLGAPAGAECLMAVRVRDTFLAGGIYKRVLIIAEK